MKRFGKRQAGGLILALLVLGGCENLGESGRDAELGRLRTERNFSVISAGPGRVVFAAREQRIVVEPPQGYCLDRKAVEVTRRSAFALVSDCLEDRQVEVASAGGAGDVLAIALPRSFPGILTVTVSGEPAFGNSAQALDAFEALIASEAGRKLLGRGNNAVEGTIIATKRVGGALYVLIEEGGAGALILAPKFWRAFAGINGRLVMVTVSSFVDRPVAEDAMLAFTANQMAQLRRANGAAAVAEEDEIAGQLQAVFEANPEGDGAEENGGVALIRSASAAVRTDGVAPAKAPRPPERYASAAAVGPARPGPGAPTRAPLAPPRPG